MNDVQDFRPHGPLRRKEREIVDRAEIDAVIHSDRVMHLALADGHTPFLVPVFYAYDGEALYFHSANAGTKIDILKRNNKVCFSISMDHGVLESGEACDFEARHRTVIGFGRAFFVEDEAAKIKALDLIVARFSEKRFAYQKGNLNRVAVVRIEIVSLTGKKHGLA